MMTLIHISAGGGDLEKIVGLDGYDKHDDNEGDSKSGNVRVYYHGNNFM